MCSKGTQITVHISTGGKSHKQSTITLTSSTSAHSTACINMLQLILERLVVHYRNTFHNLLELYNSKA